MRKRRSIMMGAAAAAAALSIAGVAVAATPGPAPRQTLVTSAEARQGRAPTTAPPDPRAAGGGDAGAGMRGRAGRHSMAGMQVDDEFDYLTMMIPHHEEAINSARVLAAGTQRKDIRAFAGSIIATQTAEVRQMRTWLQAWYPGRDTAAEYDPMMRDLTGLRGAELDRAFLTDMIPHHGMAVMMSQQLLGDGLAEHDDVAPFARNIRNTQRSEIRTMMGWLRDGGGARAGHGGAGQGHGVGADGPGMHSTQRAVEAGVTKPQGRRQPAAGVQPRTPGGMAPRTHTGPGPHGR